jgi:hypothetical protein
VVVEQQILEKLEAISTAVASLQESITLLLDALTPPEQAEKTAKPAIATYGQMYPQVEMPAQSVAIAAPALSAPPRHGLIRWLLKDGTP